MVLQITMPLNPGQRVGFAAFDQLTPGRGQSSIVQALGAEEQVSASDPQHLLVRWSLRAATALCTGALPYQLPPSKQHVNPLADRGTTLCKANKFHRRSKNDFKKKLEAAALYVLTIWSCIPHASWPLSLGPATRMHPSCSIHC
jgi:hypothetical protein